MPSNVGGPGGHVFPERRKPRAVFFLSPSRVRNSSGLQKTSPQTVRAERNGEACRGPEQQQRPRRGRPRSRLPPQSRDREGSACRRAPRANGIGAA